MLKNSILIFTLLFLTGCASTVYISSLTDPRYAPTKSDPIYILLSDDARIADRRFYGLLQDEMLNNGFNIVENRDQAKYYLLFHTDTRVAQVDSTLFYPTTSTTTGYVGTKFYSATTTYNQVIPYSYDYPVQKIWLDLYSAEDAENEKFVTIWEGYIGAGQDEYRKYTRAVLKNLLDVFGTNYQSYTPIDKKY